MRAFLERRADWHDLFHDWQALGVDDPVAREAIRARQLEAVLPPARAYGVDHGGLRGAAACALLRDKCAVHAASRCAGDELCAYDADRGLCVRRATNGTAACPAGTAAEQLVGGRWTRASSCGVAVTADVVGPLAVPGDAKMLYHWHAWFEATLLPRRNLAAPPHVIFRDGAAPVAAFAPWLGALGGNCAARGNSIRGRADVGPMEHSRRLPEWGHSGTEWDHRLPSPVSFGHHDHMVAVASLNLG